MRRNFEKRRLSECIGTGSNFLLKLDTSPPAYLLIQENKVHLDEDEYHLKKWTSQGQEAVCLSPVE